jgi:hypothetical protein
MCDGKNLDKSVPGVASVCMPAQRAPGFLADPPPINEVLAKADRHENAAGKKLCGMCSWKAKGEWRCTNRMYGDLSCPLPAQYDICIGFAAKKNDAPRPSQKKAKGICKVPPGVVMMYFGRPSRLASRHHGAIGHAGIITAAVRVKESPNLIEIGFSFCAPSIKVEKSNGQKIKQPEPWCKVDGRDKALERLVINPLIVPYLYDPLKMARQAVKAMARHDWKRLSQFGIMPAHFPDHVPSWTKNLAPVEKKESVRPHTKMPTLPDFLFRSLMQKSMEGQPPFDYFIIEETAPVPPEAWECLGKGTPTDILGRMLKDIARVGAK